MHRDEQGWIDLFYDMAALWIHDGNMKRPHALLTGGQHSNGYFNGRLITENRTLLREAVSDLVQLLHLSGINEKDIDGVVGPANGATKMAKALHDTIHASKFWASPKPDIIDGKKVMVFTKEEIDHLRNKFVLICEDTFTTGGSANRTAEAVLQAGGKVRSIVPVLVNRSGEEKLNGRKIVPLVDIHMPRWNPDLGEICPYCAEGSQAIRPKGEEEWTLLNLPYMELS